MKFRTLVSFLPVLALVAAAPWIYAADADMEKIQGTWMVESGQEGGKALEAGKVKGTMVTITADTITVKEGDQKREMTYKLDPAKNPKTIDLTTTQGTDKGKTAQGIYSLEGDSLKICFTIPGKDRPIAFDTRADSKEMLFTMKKAKP